MNNKHTGSRVYEISSQQGRQPTIAPGTGNTPVQFLLSALPTQKDSKFWYYVEAIWLKLAVTITLPTSSAFAGIPAAYLWKILASVQVQSPILGVMFSSENTRGSVLGNIIQRLGFGYNKLPTPNLIGAGGNGVFYANLYYRIPFAHNFLNNRMDTAPWAGFLEGGLVTCNIAPSNVLDDVLTNAVVNSVKASVCLTMQPEPEARIHTPVLWREHILPGSSTKFVIPDMGSPDGLQGIDQSKGSGIAHLSMLTGSTLTGLIPGTTANIVTAYSVPWRDQSQVDNPELPYICEYESQGNIAVNGGNQGALGTVSDMDFPYLPGALAPTGQNANTGLNSTEAIIFPLVPTGSDLMTSKLQTVAGAKEVNFQWGATPSLSQRFVGCYFNVFDEEFAQSLVARIAPGSSGELKAKTLNKQAGGVRNAGKLAYTPDKVVQ